MELRAKIIKYVRKEGRTAQLNQNETLAREEV